MTNRPTAPELTAAVLADEYHGDPLAVYAELRGSAPIAWSENPPIWVLSTHADCLAVNRDTSTFSSRSGILAMEIGIVYDEPPTMMHTDPPEHTRLRRAVAEGFRPSRVKALEPAVRGHVRELVAELPMGEPFEVVGSLAAPLPLMVICELLGLPASDWRLFWEWSDSVIPGAAELSETEREQLQGGLEKKLRDHIATRRSEVAAGTVGDADMVSDLIQVDLDGGALDDNEVYILLNQLLIAGNETTRNLISGGLVALAERPDEWAALRSAVEAEDHGAVSMAIEELLRFTTPVVAFMRTATTDTVVGNQDVAAGEHLLMLWASANRDASVFGEDAEDLRIDRDPNPHLAFGFGAHFCVGAALARLEARVVLEEMAARFPALHLEGEVQRSPSTVIAGLGVATLRGSTSGAADPVAKRVP